jgi:calmodulin
MDDLEELFEAFSLFDKDYNGVLTSKELGIVMQSISLNPTESEIRDMINEAETSKENSIDFPEFLAFLSRKTIVDENNPAEMQKAFEIFCGQDKKDFIDANSFMEVLKELGEPFTKEEIEKLIKEADVTRDGKLRFEGWFYFQLFWF